MKTTKKLTQATIILTIMLVFAMGAYAFTISATKNVSRNNVYNNDGLFGNEPTGGHYYIYRLNTSNLGYVNITYSTNSSTLNITTHNIRRIDVDMDSLFENHSQDVWVTNISFTTLDGWWRANEPYTMNIQGDGLQEFNIQGFDSEIWKITLNESNYPFDYASGDLSVNTTGLDLSSTSTFVVYFNPPTMMEYLWSMLVNILLILVMLLLIRWWYRNHWREEKDGGSE